MNTYNYDLATYFGAGLNEEKLKDEINSNANIVTHCADVGLAGTDAAITFSGPISAGEQSEFENVVIPAHDSTPTPDDTAPVQIKNDDGTAVYFPQTDGKTPIFQPSVIPAGTYFYGTGAFDNPTTGKIGEGDQLAMKTDGTANNEEVLEGRFITWVYIVGGRLVVFDGNYDDWLSLAIVSPASVPEDRTGTSDGNANKVSVGPFNIILPAAGDGDWNVDGSALEVGEINQSLSPVPAFTAAGDPNGWWNWDPTASPSLTPNLTGTGAYNLFDAEIILGRQANRYPLSNGDVTPAASIKAKKILPHWLWRFTLKRGASLGAAKVAIRLDTSRLKTNN